MTYIIKNNNKNKFVSELFKNSMNTLEMRENADIQIIECYNETDVKNIEDIIISFSASLTAGVVLEVLKFWICKLRSRKDYDKNYIIEVNGKKYTLEEIEKGNQDLLDKDNSKQD